jgi:hypothetical protein
MPCLNNIIEFSISNVCRGLRATEELKFNQKLILKY